MPDTHDPALGALLHSQASKACRACQRALACKGHAPESVHAARKAVRRARAVLAFASNKLDGIDSANLALRDLGRSLSGLRDAHVITEAARVLANRGDRRAWAAAIACLEQRYEVMLGHALENDPDFARARMGVKQTAAHLAQLCWDDVSAEDVNKVVMASTARLDKARKRAQADESPEHMHTWRRRARRLRMQLEAVKALHANAAEGPRRQLDKLASAKEIKRLKAMTDRLGWFQDLQVLESVLRRLQVLSDLPGLRAQLDQEIAAANPCRGRAGHGRDPIAADQEPFARKRLHNA